MRISDWSSDVCSSDLKDASCSSLIEGEKREAALLPLPENDARDQVPADDEEDVYANESAAEGRETGVEEDHRDDGNGAQAVNLPPVVHLPLLPTSCN